MVTRPDGSLAAVLGSAGGDAQPQIVLQIVLQLLSRLLAAGEPSRRAVDAGRWVLRRGATGFDTWTGPGRPTVVEAHAPSAWRAGLGARGHVVRVAPSHDGAFGHAHAIVVGPDGALDGAADPRAGGAA